MAKTNEVVGVMKSVKKVAFVGDAPKPKITRWGALGLRSPFQLNIPPLSEQVVDLGTQCDKFISLLPHGKLFPSKEVVFAPNSQLKVWVKNTSDAPVLLEVGDIVVEAVVLDNSDFLVE
jgi:hypothetical protein